jgi:hypothetical protein
MGILDFLTGPAPDGSVLDLLRANAMNQQMPGGLPSDTANYGPAPMSMAGPGQSSPPPAAAPPPMSANASMPQPSAAPMSFAPPPAQPPTVIAAAPAPPSPGFGDRLSASLGSIQHSSGLIPSLVNGISGFATGQRTDPAGVAMSANVKALQQAGVNPVAIQAAQGDPEKMNMLFKQAFGSHPAENLGSGYIRDPVSGKVTRAFEPDEKFQHVAVKNPDGSETPQSFNASTGQYSGAATPPPGKFSVDPTLTGKDRLEALRAVDPLYARKIESMVAGDLPMPTGVAALRPDAKRMIEDALAVDNATSASDFQTRAATRKDYASGIASRVTKSINTTIGHFATLDGAVDKLGNYSYFPKIANAAHDLYSSNMDPNYQKAKATFETNKEAAVKELDYALSGGHSSVSGSAELRDKFNRADSPEALHAAITEAMSLLQKRLESHTKAFTEGTKSQRDPQDFIYPENQQAFSRMLGGQAAGGAAAPAPLAPGSSATINGVTIKRVN